VALPVRQKDLQGIRSYVAWRFDYTSDKEQRGVPDHWVDQSELVNLDATKRGQFKDDCERYALSARHQCRHAHIPTRLVFCQTETGDYHLVLEVEGWIIDNRYKWVMNRDKLDYTWISMSGYEKGDPWTTIKDDVV
jgi:predicted transglutaminase-like cysteine proteinase